MGHIASQPAVAQFTGLPAQKTYCPRSVVRTGFLKFLLIKEYSLALPAIYLLSVTKWRPLQVHALFPTSLRAVLNHLPREGRDPLGLRRYLITHSPVWR